MEIDHTDTREVTTSTRCPVDSCDEAFDTKHGARIHFRYHSDDEKQEALLAGIRELNDDLGRPPTAGEMDAMGAFSVSTYQNYFSTWTDAVQAAGLEPHRNRDLKQSDLIDDLHNVAARVDRTPTSKDVITHSQHSIRSYTEQFGSWNQALRAAGFEPTTFRNLTPDELLHELKRLHDELGHVPSCSDMDDCGLYSSGTYWARFDSWNQGIRLAGFKPRRSAKESWTNYYGPGWGSRRESIIQRDRNSCRVCGISREDAKIELNVHHIRPARAFVSDDGVDYARMNDPSNLITLCWGCHMSFEGLWQDATPDEFVQRAKETLKK
jgi:hypothetical protein